ncbi:MAG TPA: hypothetical protein VGR95_00675 [Thermoanaerobaculia bacterium]|jgi:hypothetical protein|nr:hypothetical protein [Thermoanaerobaculia bacterium]
MDHLQERLVRCERRNRWLATLSVLQLVILGVAGCVTASHTTAPPSTQSLRVRELTVVDDHGTVRVRIAANLPDPVIRGKRVSRGDPATGVMLYDKTGQERGGYITFERGNQIALTLDNTDGQSALFVAPPEGGSALRLWRGKDEVTLRADEDGPRITAVEQGRVTYQEPPISAPEKTSICEELRGAKGKATDADIMDACRRAMPEAACRTCLDLK